MMVEGLKTDATRTFGGIDPAGKSAARTYRNAKPKRAFEPCKMDADSIRYMVYSKGRWRWQPTKATSVT